MMNITHNGNYVYKQGYIEGTDTLDYMLYKQGHSSWSDGNFTIEKQIENNNKAVTALTEILYSKGILTKEDILALLNKCGYSNIEIRKIECW